VDTLPEGVASMIALDTRGPTKVLSGVRYYYDWLSEAQVLPVIFARLQSNRRTFWRTEDIQFYEPLAKDSCKARRVFSCLRRAAMYAAPILATGDLAMGENGGGQTNGRKTNDCYYYVLPTKPNSHFSPDCRADHIQLSPKTA
jgi:hypothetical protein